MATVQIANSLHVGTEVNQTSPQGSMGVAMSQPVVSRGDPSLAITGTVLDVNRPNGETCALLVEGSVDPRRNWILIEDHGLPNAPGTFSFSGIPGGWLYVRVRFFIWGNMDSSTYWTLTAALNGGDAPYSTATALATDTSPFPIARDFKIMTEQKALSEPKYMGVDCSFPVSMHGANLVSVTGAVQAVTRITETCELGIQGSSDLQRWFSLGAPYPLPLSRGAFSTPAVAVPYDNARVRYVIRDSVSGIDKNTSWVVTGVLHTAPG